MFGLYEADDYQWDEIFATLQARIQKFVDSN